MNAESVFTSVFMNSRVYLICYVDDLVILTESKRALKEVKQIPVRLYQVKDMGSLQYLLGVKIERDGGMVVLTQQAYIKNVLTK